MALIAYANERNLYVVEKKEQIVSSLPTSHKLYLKNDIGKSNVIDLFTKEKTNCDILEFENIRDTYNTRKEKGGFCVPYIEQLLIEQPNFFDVNNEEYSVLTFDIETWTRGMGSFPNPNIDPITIISYKYNNEPTQVINLFDEKEKDKFILEEFFNVIKRYDPNIIIGYNCLLNKNDGFDIPYLIKRAQINSLDYKVLGRFGQDPCWTNKEGVITYNLYGRVVFDVLNQVKRDQKIEGTWDRKLKTIAEFYGFKPFKWEDIYTKETSLDMLKDERYIEHVKSDVDSTYGLFEIYYHTATAVTSLLNIPLGNFIEGSSTYPNKIFSGREFYKKRIVPFETNLSRYKKIAPDIITLNAKDKETINIQAALIKCYKEGYHPYVYGVDYRSFYPSIMKTFNISPDSVKFIDFRPKTDGVQPIFKKHKDFLEVEIPDENLGYNVHFYIDQSKKGHIKEKFDQFFDLRAQYKKDKKAAKTEMEAKRIEANSNAIKIIMNTQYGYLTSGFSYYGDLVCGIAITGFARWLITYAINSNIDYAIYSHTDSIYFNEKVDYELLNKKTAELIKNSAGFESFVIFEEQDSKSGFFYKAGNYILKKQDGKLLYHGVSMKSSKQVRFFSKLTKDFGTAILEERPRNELIDMAKRYYTFSDLSLDDFLQTTNIKRLAPGENAEDLMNSAYYSNPNAMQPALMSRMKNLYNKELMPGDTIDYYKVKYDYKLKYDSVNIVKLRELLNHKDHIIYRVMLGDINKKSDSTLLADINKLFADKNIISYIKIDANLIQQEIYREIYNKQKISIRKIETICILNRIIFDIVFKEAILTPFVLGGFVLSYEVKTKEELDLAYYRESLVKKLKIFKMDPYSLEISDNIGLDEWGEKVKAAPKKRIVEEFTIEERIAEARKAVNI